MRKKRPTKAQREEAARETAAQNEKIRQAHEESERVVKARADEERQKAEAARKAADETAAASDAAFKKKLLDEAAKRGELDREITMLDTELVALKKSARETDHLAAEATLNLIRFPDDEHHAKALDLTAKQFNLKNVFDVRVAERELLVAERDQIGKDNPWKSVMSLAMGGLAYYIASMFRTVAANTIPDIKKDP